jgi:hypothetical protein
MHAGSARPLSRGRERAAAVSHTLIVSSKPDDKMTKSGARQLGAVFPASTIRRLVLVPAGRFTNVGLRATASLERSLF